MGKKTKALIAAFLVVANLSLTACGADTAQTETTTKVPEVTAYEEPLNVETEASETEGITAEVTEESSVTTEAETAPSEDYAEIREIAEKGLAALGNETPDYAEVVKYVDVDVLWYMSSGEWISDEQLVEELKKAEEASEAETAEGINISGGMDMSEFEGIIFTDISLCTEAELQEINDFVAFLGEDSEMPFDLTITKAYKCLVTSPAIEEEVAEYAPEDAPCMYVIEYNDKCKLDMAITFLMELYNAFNELGSSEIEADVESDIIVEIPENNGATAY